ncbi:MULTISPECIES: hypothetical protein [unclassified Pseudoalteromonas]|uniref:hypothetical protein n=1 Tax=unclassified Pseudoalteromonas TaxID=194690 RepID=UPI0025B36260|nr:MULTISPECIES: hypothetical protein [unclassified Pseudoalteromonas]MDN3394580.1 hypothetical protein [Pseudoalteromonas sp. APC 3215]MDN3469640.1 hypothetical protein [Pseudoalteromonas sp. APC 4026]
MSGLYSPILEQAGFLKPKAADAEQYVAQSDGATQYWRLSEPVQFPLGYKVEITFSKANDYFKIFDSNANRFDVTQFNGEVTLRNDTNIYVNGSLSNLTPATNTEYVVKFDRTAENTDQSLKEISFIGARFNGVEILSGYVKNFRVYNELDIVIHEIPLTNKAQGATQLATVGNINAFMPNYTDAVWRKP